MQVERLLTGITTLGPKKRLCIWVNGCPRHCKGCVSEKLIPPEPKNEIAITQLLEGINFDKVEGVTISGGDPFFQTSELKNLLLLLREKGVKDILVYTGYTYQELLDRKDADTDTALANIDVLIDGPYQESQNTGKGNLKGSDNQQIYYFTPSLRPIYEEYRKEERKMTEMIIGNIKLGIGIPDKEYIDKFRKD